MQSRTQFNIMNNNIMDTINGFEKKIQIKIPPRVVISYKCFMSIVFHNLPTTDDF